jgi:hypothetical protein
MHTNAATPHDQWCLSAPQHAPTGHSRRASGRGPASRRPAATARPAHPPRTSASRATRVSTPPTRGAASPMPAEQLVSLHWPPFMTADLSAAGMLRRGAGIGRRVAALLRMECNIHAATLVGMHDAAETGTIHIMHPLWFISDPLSS